MEQVYNAIYRTEGELLLIISQTLGKAGFKLNESGYVYTQQEMNNRADTVQKWYLLDRLERS